VHFFVLHDYADAMNARLDLNDLSRRQRLADAIRARLEAHPQVSFFGSLEHGPGDAYSDVDMRVKLTSTTDRAFAEALPKLVGAEEPLLVAGWALAQLPERYGRTLYFKDYPLFWHMDIACESPEHEDGSDLLKRYYPEQIFKIWLEVIKALLRDHNNIGDLEGFMSRWTDLAAYQTLQPRAKLAHYLDLCAVRARNRGAAIEPLIARCEELRRHYLL
jgi:hypothetical protein